MSAAQRITITEPQGLILRNAPGTAAAQITAFPAGHEFYLLDTTTVAKDGCVWARVKDMQGIAGWMAISINAQPTVGYDDDPPSQRLFLRPVACATIIPGLGHFNAPRDYDHDPAGIKEAKHEGLDFTIAHAGCHPLIRAAADGTVDAISSRGDYGNHVRLKHRIGSDEWVTWYCHLEMVLVKLGDSLARGDYLGVMGSTGNSTGMHLHFNTVHVGHGLRGYVVDDVVDPEPLIGEL